MGKNILVLQGSGRKAKNTAELARSFCSAAEEAGNEVTYVELTGLSIGGCIDCKHCWKNNGECSQKDDMTQIYEYLHAADIVVLATPIYFFGMTAQIKAPLDRMYAGIGKSFGIEAMALLCTFQDSDESIMQPIIDQYLNMTNYCKYENLGVVYASGLNNEDDIKTHDALRQARELGASIR